MGLDEAKVKELNQIVEQGAIKSVFQPIISLETGEILAYEALSRITLKESLLSIDQLFDFAEDANQVWNLEKLCRSKALAKAVEKPENAKIFINVDANVILDNAFVQGFTKEFLGKYNLNAKDIVFEITERTRVDDEDKEVFQEVVNHYKKQGFEIAIDDVGAKYSNLNRISCVQPQYIKIDMELIRNIHLNKSKSSIVGIMARFCKEMNYTIIAEGIESKEELETLIRLGVTYGQGYYFQKPVEQFRKIPTAVLEVLKTFREEELIRQSNHSFFGSIETICQSGLTMDVDEKAIKAYELFEKNEDLSEICVVSKEGYFCGIMTRTSILKDFGGLYGYTLHQNHTVQDILRTDALTVNADFSVETVSKMAMERIPSEVYDAVVVLKDKKYFGIVTIQNLLSTAVTIQVKKATQANPLTSLPGNIVIDNRIDSLLGDHENYAIMYLDLDNFKAYNDIYGFDSGDQMIKILANSMEAVCGVNDFLGHIGGDDFVIITRQSEPVELGKQVIKEFRKHLHKLYQKEHWEQGYIEAQNRSGQMEKYPIASVSVAIVTNRDRAYYKREELTKRIVRAKQVAKKKQGNSVVIC